MTKTDIIEQELRQFIEDSPNLTRQDKFTVLMAIFQKHIAMEKTSHLLTMSDFQHIISTAKNNFVTDLTLPATISNREVYPSEAPHIAMINAVISHLNKADVLKRMVKIDITTKTNK